MLNDIFLASIPIFFAMDPVGLLPVFVGLTEGISSQEKKKIIAQSLVTAALVAVGFIFLGRIIFHLLGITMGDFMAAGGAILFCLSMRDLMSSSDQRRRGIQDLGAVPIGTPLIVGPAVLTIVLMLMGQRGLAATLAAVFLNLAIVGVVFLGSNALIAVLGKAGSRALSKVMSLLLAAIGVMMVRRGIIEIIALSHQ
ncbi:MAG: MarC family protein [Candidatus Omnitrophota bacterium]|nr:MarC family protein [Candidatus Omnitrophota bacterium]